jgi:hypothetical protein
MTISCITNERCRFRIHELKKELVELGCQYFEIRQRQVDVGETRIKDQRLWLSFVELQVLSSNVEVGVVQPISLLDLGCIHCELVIAKYASLIPTSKLNVSIISSNINGKHFVLDNALLH